MDLLRRHRSTAAAALTEEEATPTPTPTPRGGKASAASLAPRFSSVDGVTEGLAAGAAEDLLLSCLSFVAYFTALYYN